MNDHVADARRAAYARSAGIAYLVIIAAGIFAEFFVRSSLIVWGDAAATAANIVSSASLYRAGLAAELIMLACDVFVALALYAIFERVNRSLALLAAFFRIVHASIVGVNLLNTYMPLHLVSGAEYLGAFSPPQLHALVLAFLDAHNYGYAIGLVFFGFQCGVLAYLILKSGYVPKALGVLLMFAACGYLVDSFGRTLLSSYAEYEMVFSIVVFAPAFLGELSFALWLLVRGGTMAGTAAR